MEDDRSRSQPILLLQETSGDLAPGLRQLPATPNRFRRGATIYRAGQNADAIYLTLAGRVRLTRLAPDGRVAVLHDFQSGEIFGEAAVLNGQLRCEHAAAVDDVVAAVWPVVELRRHLQVAPPLAAWFAALLARRLRDAHDRVETLSFDSVPQRLARALLRHANRFGTRLADGRISALPVTHENLAQEVATSRELVTQYMVRFRSQGWLDYTRRAIVVAAEPLAALLAHARPVIG